MCKAEATVLYFLLFERKEALQGISISGNTWVFARIR